MLKSRYYRHDFDVLIAIVSSHRARGLGPTKREISRLINIKGNSTIQRACDRLEAAGFITVEPQKHRAMAPTTLGLVAAGIYPAEERIETLGMGA